MKKRKPDDIQGNKINMRTIPADIITTLQRPDIVIINISEKKIVLFELTVSFEKNADSTNLRISTKYIDLTSDIRINGCSLECIHFEIGSRGYINSRNKKTIIDTIKKTRLILGRNSF